MQTLLVDAPGAPGAYVVTRRKTGETIGEFFDARNVARFNPATCLIEPIGVYLARINRAIREAESGRAGIRTAGEPGQSGGAHR
jgi:hypothetical protein